MGIPLKDDLANPSITALAQKALINNEVRFEITPNGKFLTIKVFVVKFKCGSSNCSVLHTQTFTANKLLDESIGDIIEKHELTTMIDSLEEPMKPGEYCISPAAVFVSEIS